MSLFDFMIIIIRKCLILSLCLLDFIYCNKNTDSTSLKNQEQFVQVYVELVKLQDRISVQYPSFLDSSRAILGKYHFTEEEYNRSLSYLNEKPERWQTFYEKVLEQLQEE